jgi:hypothetical protein
MVNSGIIEYQDTLFPDHPPDVQLPEFATIINPLFGVAKAGSTDIRPVIDATAGGLNDHLAPWPMALPRLADILNILRPGHFLGKRDWTSGFHHQLLSEESRRLSAFVHPVSGKIMRYRASFFGGSQAPARFVAVSNEFARIAYGLCIEAHIPHPVLHNFVDDLGMAALTHTGLLFMFNITDGLAARLGVEWSARKDEGRNTPSQSMVWVGAQVTTTGGEVTVSLPASKHEKYTPEVHTLLESVHQGRTTLFKTWERIVGVLGHCAALHRWGRNYLGSLFEVLNAHRHCTTVPAEGVPAEARADLTYWLTLLTGDTPWQGKSSWSGGTWDIVKGVNFMEVGTDACKSAKYSGWGGAYGFERRAGVFTEAETDAFCITLLEAEAVNKMLKEATLDLRGRKVLLWTDNDAVVSMLNRGSVHPKGRDIIKNIGITLARTGADLRAKHIPGKLNVVNDQLSRGKALPTTANWSIRAALFNTLFPTTRPNFIMFSDEEGKAATYLLPEKSADTTVWFNTPSRPALAPAAVPAMLGKTVWVNPPWPLVGETLKAYVQLWLIDPGGTRFYALVPLFKDRWWWKYVNDGSAHRSSQIFTVAKVFSPAESIFVKTGCIEFAQTSVPVDCGPPSFSTALLVTPGAPLLK